MTRVYFMVLITILAVFATFAKACAAAVTVDTAARSIENSQLKVMYAPSTSNEEGLTMYGISTIMSKQFNENYASTIDAIGYGFAAYAQNVPESFTVKENTTQYATVNVKRTANIDVEQNLRIYDQLPVLEIEYVKFNTLWFEDFYTKVTEPKVYSIYGVDREVDAALQQQVEDQIAPQTEGENYADAVLAALGSSVQQATYNGHIIFGIYNTGTKRGLGWVMPTALGMHDGWKLWSMYNFESFPNFGSPSITYPWKRYIFLLTGGREQLFTVGKWIADHDAAHQPLTDGNPYGGAPTTAPSAAPTATLPPTGMCPKKSTGDADCNGLVQITDYAVWRIEYKGQCSTTNLTAAACGDDKDGNGNILDADFNNDGKATLTDYQIWRNNIQ